MMQASVHLHFNGDCEEAFQFYRDHLGAKIIDLHRFKETPASKNVSSEWQNKIVHGSVDLNGLNIAGDDLPDGQYVAPAGVFVLLSVPLKEVQTIFEALSGGGEILFPIQKTFWSPQYGIVRDRFGVQWKINGMTKS